MNPAQFKSSVAKLISKHSDPSLVNRWNEATSFGEGANATDCWIRESSELLNIVWLNNDGIRDIAMLLDDKGAPAEPANWTFVKKSAISGFQVREGKDVVNTYDLHVTGTTLVHVIATGSINLCNLFWIANTPEETNQLQRFLRSVLTWYTDQDP